MVIIKWFSRLLIGLCILTIGLFSYLFYDYKRFLQTPVVGSDSPTIYTVKSGDTISSLVNDFEKKHLPLASRSPFAKRLGKYYFRYLAKSNQQAHKLKIGDYRLDIGMTPPQLLNLLTSGNIITYKIQFIEGRTFKHLRKTLKASPHLEQTLIYVPEKDILATLGEKKITHPEGMFFPDTYQFPSHTKDIDILKQSYYLMQKHLNEAWQRRDPNITLKTPYELLILASIIEKETGKDGERQKISGVFHRRLTKNMPLQTDPTVIYGMGDSYQGKIYKSSLKKDTPYNTYTRKGLPPTPIAMPGKASLFAAAHPDQSKNLYFVANGKGGHTFSDTYKAHLQAVRNYRNQQTK